MKKYLILIIILLLLTGCNEKENKVTEMTFDDEYYDIMTPYKTGVGNNYVRSSVITTYDYTLVDSGLMDIAVQYFDPNDVKFQAGQYLTEEILIDLLSDENLNNAETVTIDDITIKPNYISAIHEQNFLNDQGELSGIAIALVINPYQEYQNNSGTYLYKALNTDEAIKFGQEKAQTLLKYIREIDGLEKVKIMMSLYVVGSPDEISSGNFEYVGDTTNDKITFEDLDYQYQYLTSNYVLENDLNNYTAFGTLVKNIESEVDDLYITAEGLYVNNNLKRVEITVNSSLLTKDKLLMISQLFAEEITKQFNDNILIKVYLKINDDTKALIVKKRDSLESNIYLLT